MRINLKFQVANDANSNRSGELKSWRRSLPKRLSFRSKSSNSSNAHAQNSTDKECQTDGLTGSQSSPNGKTPVKVALSSPKSSADEMSPSSVVAESSSFNLERSQSLRISRNSLRNISKGGSLR